MTIITTILNMLKIVKNNRKWILFGYLILSTSLCIFLYTKYQKEQEEANRYENNQIALMTELQEFKTKDGKNAAKVVELQLTNSEFEKLCEEQANTINSLNIKLKRVELVSSTGTKTEINATTVLHDTIIKTVIDNKITYDTLKAFTWSDTWNKIEGKIKKDTIDCNYQGNDTLTVVTTRVPKKFLFFKWGCKYVEVNISNKNTSSKIVYNQTVKLK